MSLANLQFGWSRRLPVLLQSEAAECSLVSLAMIATYHGRHTDPAALRRMHGFSLKGATLRDVIGVADRIGLAARPIRLELEELGMLRTPCILHWDLNHFVVLKSVGRGTVTIHDPAEGLRRLSLADVSRHFTGVALELTPTGGFEPEAAPPRVRIRALLGHVTGMRRALGHLLLLAFGIEVFALLAPLFLGLTVDHAIVSADRGLLATLAIAFGLLLLLQVGTTTLRGWLLMTLGASLKVQSRTNLFSHLLALPAGYFETRHTGDVMSRFDSQETILKALTTDLVVAILDGVMCLVTLAVMLWLAPMLTAVALVGAAFYGLLRWAFYMPLRQASSEHIIWAARRDSHFLETMRGVRTIKLFNGQRDRRAHWLGLLVETTNRHLATQRLNLLFKTVNALLLGVLGIAIIYLGARAILAGTFSIGLLIAFIAYKEMFLRRVSTLIDTVVDLRMLGLHAERLADIALTAPEPQSPPRAVRMREGVAIEARDLSFRYGPGERLVLDGLSFRIGSGESVAIAGPSGCGKTTLLKLLAGLLEPSAGMILVNGEPLARLGPEAWRTMIGVVLQDDSLFAGSIADNIAFFAPDADLERIEACARAAAVHDDIATMPMGYGTLIGDMGTALSGGQKQRVLLARALYRRPGALLLDEATSHLDVARENAVNQSLKSMRLTRIVVAHRPQTILAAERVITLEGGRITSDERRGNDGDDEHPDQDHRLSGDRGADADRYGSGDMDLNRTHRLLLRSEPAGPRADGHRDPSQRAHEPVLGEHRRDAAPRPNRAR
ncbi:ATP-binding cassette subfamily B protein RaxB [Amaricoccus macauensis]|uniref:ATP-binding cassette subfamily B protein RaxB n=1 Tax=Amaricoccus macauensis TaxID=57001 RepID=A0A840SIZ4_9RHOB|nr:peptidase domain-containing ABC transporter [Amaricoccus macauensis]MBB5220914.1 ATP-binding cassette subfamily B protein RaxB [Amaricoccus macauensis]